MNVNILDAHDRYEHFTKQNFSIEECCQDFINQRPFGSHAFYLFAHPRTEDHNMNKRLIWQPRLTRPKPQTNSMLFKIYPTTGDIKICWIIPDRPLWPNYNKGKMTASPVIVESIDAFKNRRHELEKPEDDDLSDEAINTIYKELSAEAKRKQYVNKLAKGILF